MPPFNQTGQSSGLRRLIPARLVLIGALERLNNLPYCSRWHFA